VAAAQTAWLTSCRARVTHFASAEEALAQDDQIRAADFFLCDYRLPGSLTGLDFLHALQARHGKIRHAALLTGDTSADFIEMATASGWPVLFKPIQPARLQHLLVPWLKNRGNPARP
jgi:CheY-like chemotaxis protein